jgi:hypothetical protein
LLVCFVEKAEMLDCGGYGVVLTQQRWGLLVAAQQPLAAEWQNVSLLTAQCLMHQIVCTVAFWLALLYKIGHVLPADYRDMGTFSKPD